MGLARKLVSAATLASLIWGSASMAAPTPVQTTVFPSGTEFVREERSGSKAAATKAWIRKKKNQTANWMGRQKRKLKNLVD